jgi:inorganic pyrophosphatase
MKANLGKLSPYDDDGALRIIVESPRALRPSWNTTLISICSPYPGKLPLGVAYPFDWGFIPATRGEDGDPLDAMALHHTSTYPVVLLPCRILGMVVVV